MKKKTFVLLFCIPLLLFRFNSLAQSGKSAVNEKLEMKEYFFVMLIKGPNRNQDSLTAAKIQDGHMNNIRRLADLGKIVVAGPFGDDGDWRGIFIFNCKTREEVVENLKTDPAVESGRLAYDIRPWWTAKNCVFK